MTTHPAIDNNKVKSILNDPYEPSPKLMALKYIKNVTDWKIREAKDWLDSFISTLQSQTGTITWYSISEGHLPAISSKYNNRSEMVLVWGQDGWVQINYYNHEIGNWFSTDFPFVITHFAYINYPEPENSGKEQSL